MTTNGKLRRLRPLEERIPWSGEIVEGADGIAMAEAIEDLALVLAQAAAAWNAARFDQLAGHAGVAGGRAEALGCERLARVARTVQTLACGTDETALAANVARMGRLGDSALCAIWQVQDRRV